MQRCSKQIYVEVWCQFAPTKDGSKWSMKAWQDKPDWLPDGKFYLVRIPVPSELIGGTVMAEGKERHETSGKRGGREEKGEKTDEENKRRRHAGNQTGH